MNSWHRITNIDDVRRIGDCSQCGSEVPIRPNYTAKKTFWRCERKYKVVKDQIERPWVKYKKDYCEWSEGCDFKIQHPCQLSVDHIDGDKTNNSPENLQTLCLNHHGLKTHLYWDYNLRTAV